MEQKFKEFLNKWIGKPCEVVDPTSKDQCFDLVVAWCDFLSIPRVFPFKFAYQIYSNFGSLQSQYFDKIRNDPNACPKEGDIAVWDWYYNYAGGHVGVALGRGIAQGKSSDWFSCFVQNDPYGEKCQVIENYSFSHVSGWLRPKNYNVILTDAQKYQKIIAQVESSNYSDTGFRDFSRRVRDNQ